MRKLVLISALLFLSPMSHAGGIFGSVGYHDYPLKVSVGFKHHDHYAKHRYARKHYSNHYRYKRHHKPRNYYRGYHRGFKRGYYSGRARAYCPSGY